MRRGLQSDRRFQNRRSRLQHPRFWRQEVHQLGYDPVRGGKRRSHFGGRDHPRHCGGRSAGRRLDLSQNGTDAYRPKTLQTRRRDGTWGGLMEFSSTPQAGVGTVGNLFNQPLGAGSASQALFGVSLTSRAWTRVAGLLTMEEETLSRTPCAQQEAQWLSRKFDWDRKGLRFSCAGRDLTPIRRSACAAILVVCAIQ
jgi:hypothetical protein